MVSAPLVDPTEEIVQRRRVGGAPLQGHEGVIGLVEHLETEVELSEEEAGERVLTGDRHAVTQRLDGRQGLS